MRTALSEAKSYLGVSEPRLESPKAKEFTRPDRPKCATPKPDSPVVAYLKGRGLKAETIAKFKIAEQGRLIVFPYLRDGGLVHWKTIGIDRDENGKKTGIRTSPGTEPCLFEIGRAHV